MSFWAILGWVLRGSVKHLNKFLEYGEADFEIAKNAFFEDPNQTAENILFYVEGGVPKALAAYVSGSKIGVSIKRGSQFKVLGC